MKLDLTTMDFSLPDWLFHNRGLTTHFYSSFLQVSDALYCFLDLYKWIIIIMVYAIYSL